MKCPCIDCADRQAICHDTCSRFAEADAGRCWAAWRAKQHRIARSMICISATPDGGPDGLPLCGGAE